MTICNSGYVIANNRVTLKKNVREYLDVEIGDRVVFVMDKGRIYIQKAIITPVTEATA